MKKHLIGLLIALAAGAALLLLINQGLFTASEEIIEPTDDAVGVEDNIIEPVEEEDTGAKEEVVVDAPDEDAADEVNEPDGNEGATASDDEEFAITDFPLQDFIQAREKGEPIVLKFYAET